jgi:H+/gluconate symporter-like permease
MNKNTFGKTGGTTGGLGIFGKVIFQFRIGLVIGSQLSATEHNSRLVNVESFTMLSTAP